MRRVTSLVLLVTFATVSVTGLTMTLFEGPGHKSGPPRLEALRLQGNVSAAIERPHPSLFPKGLHELAAYAMLVAGCVHLALNFKPMMAYVGLTSPRRRGGELETVGAPGLQCAPSE